VHERPARGESLSALRRLETTHPTNYSPKFMPFKPDKRLQKWYQKYNRLYFDNQLPAGVLVGWDEDEPEAAHIHGVVFNKKDDGVDMTVACIRLNPNKHVGSIDARQSLLHELCHLKLLPWPHHGKRFNNEMRRLAMLGALDDLW
jgi:hypothetical protein